MRGVTATAPRTAFAGARVRGAQSSRGTEFAGHRVRGAQDDNLAIMDAIAPDDPLGAVILKEISAQMG
jgi:hypothetical protein